jgi:hypothetical protein
VSISGGSALVVLPWPGTITGMGPIVIFDKSALQALSMDEAVWFDAFFLANVVPVFYVSRRSTRAACAEVARTSPSMSSPGSAS